MAVEDRRRCGYRKIGGTYLVADGPGFPCGRFPIPLKRCPVCEHVPAFTRGLQRITPATLLHAAPVCGMGSAACSQCPLGKILDVATAGLMWVGAQFYSPQSFAVEASDLGVSKRMPNKIPRWLTLGETWVFFGHEQAIREPCVSCGGSGTGHPPDPDGLFPACDVCDGTGALYSAGVFFACRPSRIERIIPDTMSTRARNKLVEQGLTLVEVPHDDPDHGGTDPDDA